MAAKTQSFDQLHWRWTLSKEPYFDLISDRAIFEIPNRESRDMREIQSGDAETAVLRFLDGRHLFIVHPTEKAAASKGGGAPLVDKERFYATLRIDAAGLVVSGDIFSDIQRYDSKYSFQSESIHVAVGTGTLAAEAWALEGFDVFVVASGSGATHSGLLAGLRGNGSKARVIGSCVRRDRESQTARIVRTIERLKHLYPGASSVAMILRSVMLPRGGGRRSGGRRRAP